MSDIKELNNKAIIYGVRAINEAIDSNQSLDKIYIQKGLKGNEANQLINKVRKMGMNLSFVPIEKLSRLAFKNHQGFVAQTSPVKFLSINDLSNLIESKKNDVKLLILDNITDVRNFGAIVRTAECSGMDCIIIQKSGSAPVNGDTIKTSAGAIFNIPVCKVAHLKDAFFLLKQHKIKIFGATEKAKQNIYKSSLKHSLAVVFGSEGRGLTNSTIKLCDELIKIPIIGKIDSLNVSVAVGTVLFEILRQKEYNS